MDPRFKGASSVQDLQIRSILCAPLWLGEEATGLIYLDHQLHAYAFSEADRDFLVAAANVAALGIQRLS
jgi:GAF domain-containing protein